MPEADLSLLREGVREASELALKYFRNKPDFRDKGDGQGPVSEADLAIDNCLKSHFQSARPDYGWLSEETDDDPVRFDQESVFIVDPIDGTRSFLAEQENWAISVAVARQGVVTAALVGMPAKGRIYEAELGKGAFMDGARMSHSQRTRIQDARILSNKANMQPDYWANGIPPIDRHFRSSLAYRLCLVAQGRFDGMITLRRTWEWDVAAGDLICREAGCAVSDMQGQNPTYNTEGAAQNGMVVATPDVHRDLLTYLT